MNRKSLRAVSTAGHDDYPFAEIIEEAYRVFAYGKPGSIEVCRGCCMDARIEADFFNPPIRELPLSYLRDWYSAAYDPKGIAKETWAYLLPRILEFMARGDSVSNVGIEVSLNRFATGNRENWSTDEWSILDRFQRLYLSWKVDRHTDFLDDAVCMFSLAGWNVADLFDQVAAIPDAKLAQRLWLDWCSWPAPGREGIRMTAFWQPPDNAVAFRFYTSRSLYERMEALVLAEDTNTGLAAKASAVASVIESNAPWAC